MEDYGAHQPLNQQTGEARAELHKIWHVKRRTEAFVVEKGAPSTWIDYDKLAAQSLDERVAVYYR